MPLDLKFTVVLSAPVKLACALYNSTKLPSTDNVPLPAVMVPARMDMLSDMDPNVTLP